LWLVSAYCICHLLNLLSSNLQAQQWKLGCRGTVWDVDHSQKIVICVHGMLLKSNVLSCLSAKVCMWCQLSYQLVWCICDDVCVPNSDANYQLPLYCINKSLIVVTMMFAMVMNGESSSCLRTCLWALCYLLIQ
jgi:hypothetical protein